MGKKPVNAVKGKQGFQRTGRTERGREAPAAGVMPVATSLADAVEDSTSIDDAYSRFSELMPQSGHVPPSDSIPSPPAGVGTSGEFSTTSLAVLNSFGVTSESERERLIALSMERSGNDNTLVDPDVAAIEVSAALNPSPGLNHDHGVLLTRIRDGDIRLTRSEVAALHNIGSEVSATRAETESSTLPFDDTGGWSPPYVNRNCTLCGQFVGKLGTHSCDAGRMRLLGPVKMKKLSYDHVDGGERHSSEYEYRALKNDIELPMSVLQDRFLRLPWGCDPEILWSYIKKPLFGKPSLPLPQELRDAYIAMPKTDRLKRHHYGRPEPRPRVVAELIDPPFTQGELQYMIDSDPGQDGTATADLLTSPKARSTVLNILENRPTEVGEYLAREGRLPVESVRNMATSGVPEVRLQAAGAKNLPPEEASRLATDPDPRVREKIVGRISEYPETLDDFVNGADENTALQELSEATQNKPGYLERKVPMRQIYAVLGTVTSRDRLEAIHRDAPSWSLGRDETSSLQGWIRSRLDG